VGSGSVGYVAMGVIDHIGVSQIQRITVRSGTHMLTLRRDATEDKKQHHTYRPPDGGAVSFIGIFHQLHIFLVITAIPVLVYGLSFLFPSDGRYCLPHMDRF